MGLSLMILNAHDLFSIDKTSSLGQWALTNTSRHIRLPQKNLIGLCPLRGKSPLCGMTASYQADVTNHLNLTFEINWRWCSTILISNLKWWAFCRVFKSN